MDPDSAARIAQDVARLPPGVQRHIEAVHQHSLAIARRWGLDESAASLAAQAHDICRTLPVADLLSQARAAGIPITPVEEAFPVFLHGPLGAEIVRRRYGLRDPSILNPIRYHTMGRAGMSPQEHVLFLADKFDPAKRARYPWIADAERLAQEDLGGAMLLFLTRQMQAFLAAGALIHPGMLAAYNDLLARRGGAPAGA
jgi:predicted HD superfamily hydrolase involved in NAD metabolism